MIGAIAADWESGAIAYVAGKNEVKCLILRAVTDIGDEIYRKPDLFRSRVKEVMPLMIKMVPEWIMRAEI